MNNGRGRLARRAGALAAMLAMAAAAAACGGGSSDPVSAQEATYQQALKYSQCMRSHGEPGFPDPQANGNLLINGQQDHLNNALMNSANRACQHFMPKIKPMTAAQQRQVTAEALRFVACMRAHGIAGMPDPVVNSQGIAMRLPNGYGPNSPVLQSAQRACSSLAPGFPGRPGIKKGSA